MLIGDSFAETRSLVDATSVSYPDANLLRRYNAGYEEVVGDLIDSNDTWQFDDSNYTNLPIGTATLVEGQSSYTFDTSLLDVENVKIMDLNGHWHILKPIDQSQTSIPLENYLITNQFPRYYDKEGNTINLLPAPTGAVITLIGGLKVQFKRTAKIFVTGDIATNTLSPGFASPYHILLCYKAALPYAMTYKKDRVAFIQQEITRLHALLITHYSMREQDKRKIMKPKPIRHR